MSSYESLEEALAVADTAESLALECKDLQEISERLGELTNLRSLRLDNVHADLVFPASVRALNKLEKLDISGALDASVPFPKVFNDTPITDLELRNFRVREAFGLKGQLERFRICSHFIFDDMVPLFSNFEGLEYLEIWGRHGKNQAGNPGTLKFPPEIANLENLRELEVVYAGMRELPAEMAQLLKLSVVRLRKHEFEAFPVALTTVPNLEDLEFSHMASLRSFPAEVANMTALRRLDLSHSWNGPGKILSVAEEMDSLFEDSDVESDPLPDELALMTGLEELLLDHCKVGSVEPIEGLTALKTLSLAWAPLTDLKPLSAMKSLARLELEHCAVSNLKPLSGLQNLQVLNISNTKVSNFAPLAGLQDLRSLDIQSCTADNRNPLKALEALIDLPNLLEVKSDEFDEGAWEKLRSGGPSDAERIVAGLQSDSFDEFMGALQAVIDYSEERSTDDHNALVDLFGLDVDDYDVEPVEFEPLDTALDRWGREISAMNLAGLARATFVCTSDGWVATLKALRLLIQSQNLEAQLFFVEAWERATQYYDGGHRFWENGVHDLLIDELFEQFQPEAIAALMLTLDGDQLNSEAGDAMDVLYEPALKGLKAYDEELIEHLREHALSNLDDSYGSSPTDTLSMIEDCIAEAIQPIQVALREIAAEMRRHLDGGADEEVSEADAGNEEVEEAAPSGTRTANAEPVKVDSRAILLSLQAAFDKPGIEALQTILHAIADAAAEDARVLDGATAFTNNKLIGCLRGGEVDRGVELIEAFQQFVETAGMPTGLMRNEIAGNTVVLAVHSENENIERFCLDKLVPEHIAHTGLAYNLSCYWAKKGNRSKMLETIVVAIELGKEADRFLADTDFEPYWQDAAFLKAIGREPSAASGPRRFEFRDAKSAKFWSVETVGADLNLTWGKIGTAGQTKTKTFPDADSAAGEAEKLIKSKTKKGYEEV